jgi:hypothetical protein
MISTYRSAVILPGKFASAVTFAKQIAAYVKDAIGVDVGVAMPYGGNPMRIGWSSRYENLGAYEAAMAKLLADPKYMEMTAKGSENFIAGSVHDEIWRGI